MNNNITDIEKQLLAEADHRALLFNAFLEKFRIFEVYRKINNKEVETIFYPSYEIIDDKLRCSDDKNFNFINMPIYNNSPMILSIQDSYVQIETEIWNSENSENFDIDILETIGIVLEF